MDMALRVAGAEGGMLSEAQNSAVLKTLNSRHVPYFRLLLTLVNHT